MTPSRRMRSVFRRHPPQNRHQVAAPSRECRQGSLRKDGSSPDLTESTLHDLESSLSQLELRRNQSYETEEAPTTLASTQPTTASDNDRTRNGPPPNRVEYAGAAAAHPPPPESVSLMESDCSCSALSDDDDDSVARRRRDQPLPNANEQEASSTTNLQVSQQPAPCGGGAAAFVPPEYVYLTPDNCWPLEL